MQGWLVISLGLALGACGGATDSNDDSSAADAIIGGKADATDSAIVELVESIGKNDEYTCTATFISTKALLTAAHCVVDEKNPKKLAKGATFQVMRAQSSASAKKSDFISVRLANVHPHPGYDGEVAHDVAVVVLDQALAVTPIALRRTAITKDLVGSAVRIVGYGQTKRKASSSDVDARRSVMTTLRGLDDDLVHIGKTGQQACDGDSGGPALLTVGGVETLIATDDVASSDADCTQGDLYQRVDLQLAFIDQYL